eukprot:TRINITY_DN72968_c0_g1_i1.p1 TRINITY_DN72968_c0_g1~~TRINITY_DN72968_c0_g1_i1.p1  ORF type:complete len:269 (+),score=35.57 TRINITY_DN72968_c0_g1_i1:43-849(+)
MMASLADAGSTVTVRTLAGLQVAQVLGPILVSELKRAVTKSSGTPAALQKLVRGDQVLHDNQEIPGGPPDVQFVLFYQPCCEWDVDRHPNSEQLQIRENGARDAQGSVPSGVPIMTQEPLTSGVHFFEVVIHQDGNPPESIGLMTANAKAKLYKVRQPWEKPPSQNFWDMKVALNHKGEVTTSGTMKAKACAYRPRDVVGILVHIDIGAAIIMVNNAVQACCALSAGAPLHVACLMDKRPCGSHVELQELSTDQAPSNAMQALVGPLL